MQDSSQTSCLSFICTLQARESGPHLSTILDLTDLVLTAMSEPYEPYVPTFNPRLSLIDPAMAYTATTTTTTAAATSHGRRASSQHLPNHIQHTPHHGENGSSQAFTLPPLHALHEGIFLTDSAYGHSLVPEHSRSASGSAIPPAQVQQRGRPTLPSHLNTSLHTLSSPASMTQDTAPRLRGAATSGPRPTSGGGSSGGDGSAAAQHISTCLIEGTSAFSPEVVASTPPELLVSHPKAQVWKCKS